MGIDSAGNVVLGTPPVDIPSPTSPAQLPTSPGLGSGLVYLLDVGLPVPPGSLLKIVTTNLLLNTRLILLLLGLWDVFSRTLTAATGASTDLCGSTHREIS